MASLYNILRAEARMIKMMGHNPRGEFHSMQEFVLYYGKKFNNLKRAPRRLHGTGAPKQCFANAANAVFRDPDNLIYCEGYILFHVPIYHAWVVNAKTKQLIDPTLADPPKEYFGVQIKYDFLDEIVAGSRYSGVIDRPDLDWPIYTRPKEDWLHKQKSPARLLQPGIA